MSDAKGIAAGERRRLLHHIERTRALLDALESTVVANIPCSENAQAFANGAITIVASAARLDVHLRAEVK